MNLYDGILFAILVFFMILGFIRGILKEIAALLLIVIPMLAAVLFSPFLAEFLQKNTKITLTIEKALLDKQEFFKQAEKQTESSKIKEDDEKIEKEEKKNKEKGKKSDKVRKENQVQLKEKDVMKYFAMFHTDVGNEIRTMAIRELANKIVKSLAFIIIYFVFYIVIVILYVTLKIIVRIPVLSSFNRFFGAMLGLFKGILLVSVILLSIPVLYVHISGMDKVLDGINKSVVLKQLYDKNIVIHFLKIIFK